MTKCDHCPIPGPAGACPRWSLGRANACGLSALGEAGRGVIVRLAREGYRQLPAEASAGPAAPDSDGPGSILAAFLASWGFGSCSACAEHAARMDALGAPAVLADLDSHVAEIKGRAGPVPSALIRERVGWACRESLRRRAARPDGRTAPADSLACGAPADSP